jgi:hypothetical protein
MTLKPSTGFDWHHVAWGHPDSPRSFLCSYCSAPIGEEDVPLMLTAGDGRVAQFCNDCMMKWWGLR